MSQNSVAKKGLSQKRLGEIFIEMGLINEITLERTLASSHRNKTKLGVHLEGIGLITDYELAEALSSQYGYRVVRDFAKYRYAKELLELIPRDIAINNNLFPLKIESGRFAIAVADLTDIKAAEQIATSNNLKLVPFIATIKDIKAAHDKHYPQEKTDCKKQPQKPKTILLVEDDRLTYTILQNILTGKGYRVLLAFDGMEAYSMILKDIPDLIITDKVMPKMDGYGLQAALRAQPETRDIPMIMISSSNNSNEEATAFERGFFDYLSKPIREVTLLTRVERAILFAENK